MKKLIITSCGIITALAMGATDLDNVANQQIKIGDDTYQISCDAFYPELFNGPADPNAPTNFFIYDDCLYFNNKVDSRHTLHRYDFSTETLDEVNIDWNGIIPASNASFFCGMDSEGIPYVASQSAALYQEEGYPFAIFPLEFNNGIPTVTDKIVLRLIDEWWSDEVSVLGSLNNKNFRLTACIKTESVKGNTTWGYAEWHYDGSEQSTWPIACAKLPLNIGKCIPAGEDYVVIYDAAIPFSDSDKTEFIYTTPTLCKLDDQYNSKIIDTFDGEIDNIHGTGLDIVNYDGKHFMLYGSGFAPSSYAVAYLPDFPASISSSQHLWTLGTTEKPYSTSFEAVSDYKGAAPSPLVINSDRDTSAGLKFYTYTNCKGLAKYTITKVTGQQVGISEVSVNADSEYYTLEGIKLPSRPSSSGVYICRRGLDVTKIHIK